MAKDALFFSHDLNARHDKKIAALVREFKSAGYGIYWCVVEMLHEEGGSIELDELSYGAISHDLNEDMELVKKIISKCVSYKLFSIKDHNSVTANRVLNNLTHRDSISKKRSNAGQKGAIAKQEQANAKQVSNKCNTSVDQNDTNDQQNQAKKERKKERDNTTTEESEIPEKSDLPEIGSEVVLDAAKKAWEDQKWREQVCLANYFKPDDLKQWMYMYNASLTGDTNLLDFSPSRYKKMFNGWLQSKKSKGYTLPERPKSSTGGLRTLKSE